MVDIRSSIEKMLADARQAGLGIEEVLYVVNDVYYSTDLVGYIRGLIERDQKV